jgi:cobyrinic acid a,c-diamide synthase
LANGLVIAAPRSGSGKTTVTLGLLAALKARGIAVAPAKTGPDYIDRTILEHASGAPAINLDPWAMSPDRLRQLASDHAAGADLLLVEGVMGLFDGAASGTGSTGDLAATLDLPVVLVVDADRQSQSIAALVHGFATWRPNVRVAGLIINRAASTRHETILRAAVEELDIPLLGILPRRDTLALPSRHLGLVLPSDLAAFDDIVSAAAEAVSDYLDLNHLLALSSPLPSPLAGLPSGPVGDKSLQWSDLSEEGHEGYARVAGRGGAVSTDLPPLAQHTAIARDAAFAFIYPHWLTAWQNAGATLSFFSPLADETPDPSAGAVFLPGGYPELHAAPIARAHKFMASLDAFSRSGRTIYGECGGFMVLGKTLTDKDGVTHPMAGLLPHETRIDRPKRVLGYRKLTHTGALPWPKSLTGHEFHYSSARVIRGGTPLFTATDALGEELPPMGLVERNVMGSYAHVIDIA